MSDATGSGGGQRVARVALAVLFVGAGVLHFVRPEPYVAIVPPALPNPELLVAISGVAEVVGGVALLVRRLRRAAGVGLILLLLAVYPANVYMAVADVPLGGVRLAWWAHAVRLAFQFVLIGLVAWSAGLWRGRSPVGAAQGSRPGLPSAAPHGAQDVDGFESRRDDGR